MRLKDKDNVRKPTDPNPEVSWPYFCGITPTGGYNDAINKQFRDLDGMARYKGEFDSHC